MALDTGEGGEVFWNSTEGTAPDPSGGTAERGRVPKEYRNSKFQWHARRSDSHRFGLLSSFGICHLGFSPPSAPHSRRTVADVTRPLPKRRPHSSDVPSHSGDAPAQRGTLSHLP